MFENDINFDDEDFFEKISNGESPIKVDKNSDKYEEEKELGEVEEDAVEEDKEEEGQISSK